MIPDDLKHYVNAEIEKALKSKTPVGLPLDSDLIRQLTEVELQLKAVIVSLRGLPPELGWWENFATAYTSLKNRQQQDAASGIAELRDLLKRYD
jgi:hypothetical protein